MQTKYDGPDGGSGRTPFRVTRRIAGAACLACAFLLVWALGPVADEAVREPVRTGTLADLLRADKVELYAALETPRHDFPTAVQIRRFSEALRALREYEAHADVRRLERARGLLRSLDYALLASADGHWYLRDRRPARGWGHYILNRAPRSRLLVEVPRTLDERYALEAGLALYYESGARALAIAGAPSAPGIDVLKGGGTFFHAFHLAYAQDEVLAVRGPAYRPGTASPGWSPGATSRLWVNDSASAALAAEVRQWVEGPLVSVWKALPTRNIQRDATPGVYAELYLDIDAAVHMVTRLESRAPRLAAWRHEAIRERLDEWLQRETAAMGGTAGHRAGWRLAYFEREVLTPLLALSASGGRRGNWSPVVLARLRALHYMADATGHTVLRIHDRRARQAYLVLDERDGARSRYIFRAGGGDNYAVNAPGAAEAPQALAYGLKLFHALKARALLVCDTKTEPERYALAHRVLQREWGDEEAFLTVVSRGWKGDDLVAQADVALALADGSMSWQDATPLATRLLKAVKRSGLRYRLLERGDHAALAEARRHVDLVGHDEVVTLWVSPGTRFAERPPGNRSDTARDASRSPAPRSLAAALSGGRSVYDLRPM